ncbi:hypothetical protein FOA52_009863 [Chlamydomonas sp. UWO 241]|nr:hypothetical protein FOA52_009863 [Chlamydomonas sp. UWO 241]
MLLCRSEDENQKPPLLFLHGSYHGAWCWQERFLPYFAEKGFNSYALSFRGQGNSDIVTGQTVSGTLDSHAKDIGDLIAMLPRPPVVVAHSFGGLILQKYLLGMSKGDATSSSLGLPPIAGAVFLCSVPPSGNKKLVGRYFMRDPLLSLRVTYGFIAKTFVNNLDACRELFFSESLPENEMRRYQAQLAQCSGVRLMDLQDVNKQVPLPAPPSHCPPVLVLGARNDVVVDVPAIEETAAYFSTTPVIIEDLAHDCMLDTNWGKAAGKIDSWLQAL